MIGVPPLRAFDSQITFLFTHVVAGAYTFLSDIKAPKPLRVVREKKELISGSHRKLGHYIVLCLRPSFCDPE